MNLFRWLHEQIAHRRKLCLGVLIAASVACGAYRAVAETRPVQSKIRVLLFAARTLNATGQCRVTLSLR